MSRSSESALPIVTDEDVQWACQVMQLPPDAFRGSLGDDPRLEILKSSDTLDIEACPGSGKTTLLVAKLAILARKWTDEHRGLCVLSHTNVARREIEERLGSTPEGRRLLSYPHFIGTIHAFVNEFLALPWLRSKQWKIAMIDDDVALSRRWDSLPKSIQSGLRKYSHNGRASLRVESADFGLGDIAWGKGKLNETASTYKQMQRVCEETSREGCFCHDEMFVWAGELLDRVPDITRVTRGRFPVLFIDEVQDNSEMQSALLSRLFREGENPVIRQRFGDSNQAIFSGYGEEMGATTDVFPNPNLRKDVPNSHRFCQEIADIVNSFAADPPGLVGQGPSNKRIMTNTDGKHTIFLFDDETIAHTLPAYAQYLLEVFSNEELQYGTFTAVGAIHRSKDEDHIPYSVCDYWEDYVPGLTSPTARLRKFCEHVQAGRRLASESGEVHGIVEGVAAGILDLARILNPSANLANRRRKHRYMLELLDDQGELKTQYLDVTVAIASDLDGPSAEAWKTRWLPLIIGIAKAIADVGPTLSLYRMPDQAQSFLEWATADDNEEEPTLNQRDNVFKYPSCSPKVQIQVGSIHSVKGETHTATLVLDTFFRTHNIAKLKPWLLGKKLGGRTEDSATVRRLKQHYVAMTRPTHLLCLAMRQDALKKKEVGKLKSFWRVARVGETDVTWL